MKDVGLWLLVTLGIFVVSGIGFGMDRGKVTGLGYSAGRECPIQESKPREESGLDLLRKVAALGEN